MTSKEKRKGTYHENWWVSLFNRWGWKARRQPLSGILKDFPNDIEIQIKDMSIICESKYRANGFALISSYLGKGDIDLLLLKEKNSNAYICFNVKNRKTLKMLGVKMK